VNWNFEPGHSAAEFCCRHMMVTWVRGHFKNMHGRLTFDPDTPNLLKVEAEIDATALWTGEPDRDNHLRSEDFFHVEKYPKITFRSSSVDVLTPHEWRVHGPLTIRGVTRPVVLKVQYLGQWETPFWEDGVDKGPMMRAGFCATTLLDRHDFGVSWNGELAAGGVVVGDEVLVTLDVEAIRKK
jgi:polyisoprenoid-binding protein YceI